MKYDLEQTFAFVKNDKEWVKKLILGAALGVLALVLLIFPIIYVMVSRGFREFLPLLVFCLSISGVIGLGITGFLFQTAHDYLNNPKTQMPQWGNFKSLVFIGFKAFLGSILFYLPVIFTAIIAGALELAAQGKAPSSSISNVSILFNVFYQVLNLFYMMIYLLFSANFLKDFNLFEYLNYKKAFELFKNNKVDYIVLVLIVFALGMLFNIGSVLLCLTIIGILLIPFGAIYIQVISCVLIARFVQISQEPKA